MKTKTTSTNLIDVLPTLFGLIAIVGALNRGLWGEINLGPMMLFGGGAAALATGVMSIATARAKNSFNWVHALNVVWVAIPALFGLWTLLLAVTWNRFLGG